MECTVLVSARLSYLQLINLTGFVSGHNQLINKNDFINIKQMNLLLLSFSFQLLRVN